MFLPNGKKAGEEHPPGAGTEKSTSTSGDPEK